MVKDAIIINQTNHKQQAKTENWGGIANLHEDGQRQKDTSMYRHKKWKFTDDEDTGSQH